MLQKTCPKLCLVLGSLALLCAASIVQADPISATEVGRKTMSKFMLNLAKFITWPEVAFDEPSSTYKYCILGDNSFEGALEVAMEGKTTKKRNFVLYHLPANDVSAAKDCQVVFISGADLSTLLPAIDELQGLPVLTVGEMENFAQNGGMIGFNGKGRKVSLSINKNRLENAGLTASSKLYRASTM